MESLRWRDTSPRHRLSHCKPVPSMTCKLYCTAVCCTALSPHLEQAEVDIAIPGGPAWPVQQAVAPAHFGPQAHGRACSHALPQPLVAAAVKGLVADLLAIARFLPSLACGGGTEACVRFVFEWQGTVCIGWAARSIACTFTPCHTACHAFHSQQMQGSRCAKRSAHPR